MRLAFINIWLMFFLGILPAQAAQTLTPIKEKLYYEANWSGINFGKIGIEIDQEANMANVTCDITTSGILAWFVKHSSHSTLTASGHDFTYPDRVYDSNYHTRKKVRHVKLTYKSGKISEQIIEPPDSKDKRPEVPEADINSAYDLMSFLLRLRNEITKAKNENKTEFTLNTYDGRRLSQADFKITGEKDIKIAGTKQSTTVITARRKFLAGYTASEIEKYDPDEPSLTIYFSNDEKLLPLRMEVPFFGQNISATLIKKCGAEESCLLGNKD